MSETFKQKASSLVATALGLHARGWLLGTSGNLSAVVETTPLSLAITPSGADKGELVDSQILLIDEHCQRVDLDGQQMMAPKPSDESPLHVVVVKARGAGAVIHTHSVWSTILSDRHALDGGLWIEDYEMLKGLQGVSTHQHREWIPIIENSQDMTTLAKTVNDVLVQYPNAHAFLLRRHGLYTWGRDVKEAKRHAEILEFLLEVFGRVDG